MPLLSELPPGQLLPDSPLRGLLSELPGVKDLISHVAVGAISSDLPFDISGARGAATAIAETNLGRLSGDLATYSAQMAGQTTPGLTPLDAAMYQLPGSICPMETHALLRQYVNDMTSPIYWCRARPLRPSATRRDAGTLWARGCGRAGGSGRLHGLRCSLSSHPPSVRAPEQRWRSSRFFARGRRACHWHSCTNSTVCVPQAAPACSPI